MTTSRSALLISLISLILLALVPAVSANEVIYDRDLYELIDTSKTGVQRYKNAKYSGISDCNYIGFKDITEAQKLNYLIYEASGDHGYWLNGTKIKEGRHEFTYYFNDANRPGVLYLNRKTNLLGQVTSTQFTIFLNDWDIGSLTGSQVIEMPFYIYSGDIYVAQVDTPTNTYVYRIYQTTVHFPRNPVKVTESTGIEWKHHIRVTEDFSSYYVDIDGFIDGHRYTSQVNFKNDDNLFATFTNPGEEIHRVFLKTQINLVEIISPQGTEYAYPLFGYVTPEEPTVTPEEPTSRTVTVTMRDIDDNTIRGFEVRAVNAVTGEVYTTSTNTDVAYITLPMDRIATVTNPETGEYEEAPVGYYNFYGIKSGYKMFPDYAIRVNVLPVKYMPDVFCDIIVAPDGSVPDDPYNSPVYVYVRNSQTGALLADATVIIKDTTTDPWTEVVNQTLPPGQGTFYLPNDPGSNPDQYYITALLPGYSDIYNGRFFRVAGPIYITVYMEPIEGGPADENNTILEFYVRDPDGNPISDAMVYVADEARWTNAQGWIRFEVPKNAAYTYTVRKFGYFTIEGRVTVGDGPRHTVNVVLSPESIPTQPPGPGLPTPTQPPSGVPGDDGSQGFLSEAVRGISKIFGVGFATGKTIFGMLLALAIGFTTAKHLRGGAAEFGLGLLGGTMLGVLIGLLPVWTIVVLLLVVGMYIGYRYVGGGNNG